MRNRLRASLAALAVAATACLPVGAAAATTSNPHQQMAADYTSLSGSLIRFYAAQSKQDLSSYLASQKLLLVPSQQTLPDLGASSTDGTPTPGTPTPGTTGQATPSLPDPSSGTTNPDGLDTSGMDTSSLLGNTDRLNVAQLASRGGLLLTARQAHQLAAGATPITARNLHGLDRQLAAAGVSISAKAYKNLGTLARAVSRSARTPDGAVTLAGSEWATQVAALRVPKLRAAHASTPGMPSVPADALPYGLLLNKSMTALVTDYPNLVAHAQKSGLGSPALTKAWNTSMAKAYASTSVDLNHLLPNACVGDMMAVMASGSAGSAKGVATGQCSPACVTGGKYLHNQAGALFNPQQNSLTPNITNPAGGVLNSASMKNMATWAQTMINSQNPQLSGSPFSNLVGTGAGSCSTAAAGSTATLKHTLPGVFSKLRH